MRPTSPLPHEGARLPAAVVLAAGRGTRMRSRHPKAVHLLLGKPMTAYPVDACRQAGAARVIVVVGWGAEAVRSALGPDLEYVEQPEPLGTGHAAAAALEHLEGVEGPVLILPGDNVLVTGETLSDLLRLHRERGADATLLSAVVPDPGHYGRVVRGEDGRVLRIVEAKGASPEALEIREINAAVYAFDAAALRAALPRLAPDPVTGEIYLTDAIGWLAAAGRRVEALRAADPELGTSINNRIELAEAAAVLRRRILRRLMLDGVTIEDPSTTYVEADVRIGQDSVLRPLTYLAGRTVIGEECEIGPSVRITDCTLGNGVTAQYAVLAESSVGDGTRIGPFAQLRPGCRVGRRVKIGNFVELKNAEVEDRASMGHLAYLGDVFVGEGSNIGAGTITCNYDGRRKHPTRIGRGSFVGSDAVLVAPVTIGDGAYVAAGSVITEDVEPDALALGRARQVNKPEWARNRRAQARLAEAGPNGEG